MTKLVSLILNNNLNEANEELAERMVLFMEQKYHEMKKATAAKMFFEEEQLDEARVKIVTRVRNGKVQRRKKVSNVPGMTIRGGKLKRMSPAERRRRKMGARRAKIKRKGKMSRILMKRKRSMRRRQSMGL